MENALLQTAYETLVLSPGHDRSRTTCAPPTCATRRNWLGKDGAPIEYAKLDPNIQQALQSEAVEFARERRLRELTDSLQLRLKPTLYKDRLKRIAWPVPPAAPAK